MQRRGFVAGLASTFVCAARAATAQPAAARRIGYLGNASRSTESYLVDAFRQGLRDAGYVEDRDVAIEYRWAESSYGRLPALAAELVRLKVDVVVTAGTPAALAATQATKTIPIVMAAIGDPVGLGLVGSLGRPGSNLTGSVTQSQELEGKRFQLLRELLPHLARAAVLWNPANPFDVIAWKHVQAAARMFDIKLQSIEVQNADQFEDAFKTIAKGNPDALLVIPDRFLLGSRARIVDFAARDRLPAMYGYDEFVHAGGLFSYAASNRELFRRAATYVDKILKGAKPADLPMEQPTKFELVFNIKTAKALGLAIPPSLLARADRVIE